MSKTPRSGPDDVLPDGVQILEIVDPQDPNERLQQLQAELTQHNSRIDQLSKQRDLLESDINGLSTTVQQVKTTVTNYGAGLKDLHNRFQALEYFYRQKSKMVLAAIGERKPLIDELLREYDDELGRMQETLRELSDRQNAAQAESNEAARVQDARQSDYDAANNYQQTLTSKLTEMETLRTDIAQADEITDVATMYFLSLEFHGRLRDTRILSQHDLSVDLRQKLGELEVAKENARAKSAALSKVQAEYTAYKTEVDNKRTGRRANLLKEVETRYPLPVEAAPAGSDAAPAGPASGQQTSPTSAPAGTPAPLATPKK